MSMDRAYRTLPGDLVTHETTGEVRQVVAVWRCEDLVVDGRYYARRHEDRNAMYAMPKLGIQAKTPETFRRD